jgi:ferredoxin
MRALLRKEKLIPLLERLKSRIEVIAPILVEGEPVFSTWHGQPLSFDKNPLFPPLEFLLPLREVLFRYIQYSGSYTIEAALPRPRLILGIRPCDLRAVAVLDRIFGSEPCDGPYLERRRSIILAALSCTVPGEGCFCASLGSGPGCEEGYDILLTELETGYLVETGSPAGMLLLRDYSEFFEEAGESHLAEKAERLEASSAAIKARSQTLEQIRDAVKKADWDSLGRHCLSCGGCAFVCPICHCFNIFDLGVPDGERVRCRDSCIFSGFSRMASGANPMRTPGERMRNWYQEKFEFLPARTGLLGCVGCGRCSKVCLAEIDRLKPEVRR